jgi:hypothetical protein
MLSLCVKLSHDLQRFNVCTLSEASPFHFDQVGCSFSDLNR